MKKNTLLFIICALIQSCDIFPIFPKDQSDEYVIVNESDYTIEVTTFLGGKIVDSFEIEQKEETSRLDRDIELGRGLYSFFPYPVDSIWVDFDSKKRLVQSCSGRLADTYLDDCKSVPKNLTLLNTIGFKKNENKMVGRELVRYSYSITFDNSDYEQAVEL